MRRRDLHGFLLPSRCGYRRLAAHAEPVERVVDRKDVRARVKSNVVMGVICAATAAADGYLICEFREEMVEAG